MTNPVETARLIMLNLNVDGLSHVDQVELVEKALRDVRRLYWRLDYAERFTGRAGSKSRNQWIEDILYVERCSMCLDLLMDWVSV